MNKVPLGEKTYCYEDFITKEQQDELYHWVFNSFPWMNFANPCNDEEDQIENPVRHFARIDLLPTIPPLFWDIHDKIVELEGINPVIEAPQNGHWVGLTGKEARVEPHTDWNGKEEGWYCRRYNLLVSLPEAGWQPLYGGEVLNVKERMLWRCDAGLVEHSSIPNEGNRLRANISFGFLIPVEK